MTDDGPAWGRVYADLRRAIESGRIAVGHALPGVSVLRERHDVGGATVQRALDELRALGMISEARKGARPKVIASRPQDPISDLRGKVAELEERVERLERDRDA